MSLHPPLQLRLTAPDEPGFRVERVPVRTLNEVWAIMEASSIVLPSLLLVVLKQNIRSLGSSVG